MEITSTQFGGTAALYRPGRFKQAGEKQAEATRDLDARPRSDTITFRCGDIVLTNPGSMIYIAEPELSMLQQTLVSQSGFATITYMDKGDDTSQKNQGRTAELTHPQLYHVLNGNYNMFFDTHFKINPQRNGIEMVYQTDNHGMAVDPTVM